MKKLIVFISKFENSLDGAKKIKNEADFDVDIVGIEDFYENNEYEKISKDDIIFFLCASPLIFDVATQLNKMGCGIFNREYFLKNLKKKDIQLLLQNNNIKIPSLYTEDITKNNEFPIFCKENMHTGITIQIYNKNSQDKFFGKFDENDFYLEEPVKIENSKEIKIYSVDGKIYYKNGQKQNNIEIDKVCAKIRKIFNNIEIFSIDFIYNEKEYYLIDFNPSSGFFATNDGRKGFVEYCNKVIKDI